MAWILNSGKNLTRLVGEASSIANPTKVNTFADPLKIKTYATSSGPAQVNIKS